MPVPQFDLTRVSQAQGIQRAQHPNQWGFTGFDDRQTQAEKEEEKRRRIEVPGFFGSIGSALGGAIDWLEKYDAPLSEKLGIEVAERKGPIDDILRFGVEELTRPSTLAIAAGGIGLAGKLGRGATLARQAAASRSGLSSALLRGAGIGARAGQFAVAPVAGARGISFPVRLGAEAATVAGFRGAAEATSERIPESAPGLFKVGAPLAVGLLGGIGGARASMGAMSRLGLNVANEKGLRAINRALKDKESQVLSRRKAEVAERVDEEILADTPEMQADRDQLKAWNVRRDRAQGTVDRLGPRFGDTEATMTPDQIQVLRNAEADLREVDELIRPLERKVMVDQVEREYVAAAEQARRARLRPEAEARADILGAQSGDDVRRRAHIMEWAHREAKNQTEMKQLADDIRNKGEYIDASGNRRGWDETPGFLGGREDAIKLQNAWAMRGMAGSGYVSRKMIEMDAIMNDATVMGKSLKDVILSDGTLDPWLRENGLLELKNGRYVFTDKAKAYRDAIDDIRHELDVQREAERMSGIELEDITGESLADIPDDVVEQMQLRWDEGTMPYFGDLVERLGDAQGYFPRFVTQGQNATLKGGRPSFGGAFFEEGRLPGFSEGAEYQRQMFENAKDMRNADLENPDTYLGDVLQVMGLRLQAGVDRINAEWLRSALTKPTPGIGQMSLLEKMMGNVNWGTARSNYVAAQEELSRITKALSGIRSQAARALDSREAQALARLNSRMPKLLNDSRDHAAGLASEIDSLTRDMELAGLSDRKYYSDLRALSVDLQKTGAEDDIHKIMDLINKADTKFIEGDLRLSQRVANMSASKRAGFDEATNRSQDSREFLRETNAETARMNRVDGRISEIQKELEATQTLMVNNIPATARLADLQAQFAEAVSRRNLAKQNYDQAMKEASADRADPNMLSGRQGKLNNFIGGGRFYDAEFANEMNKFFEMADRQGIGGIMRKFNDFARPLMATLDLSSIGIQGLLSVGVDPLGAAKMMTRTTLALFSPRFYNRWVVKNKNTIDDFIKDGGYFAALDDVGEFLFPGGITNVPVLGKPVKLANHHFSRTGNALRIMMYKNAKNNSYLLGKVFGRGALNRAEGLGEAESIIQSINEATGFKAGRPSTISSAVFFAPRYFNSQLSLLQKAASQPGADGRLARDYFMRTLAVMGFATYWLNDMQGYDTDFNPIRYDAEGNPHYNSNFMRIHAKGQDVSLFGTWDSLLGLFGTLVTEGPSSGAVRLFRTKASPAMGTMFDVITEETFMGEPVKLRSSDPREIGMGVINLMQQKLPFTLQDTIEDVTGTPNFNITDVDTYGNPLGLGIISNVVGLKATPQTPYERRDTRAQELYQKEWKQLTPREKAEVERLYPDVVEAIDARLEKRASNGDVEAQAQLKKKELAAELFLMERNLAVAVESGQIPRNQFSKIYGDLQRTFAAQKRVIDEMHGLDYADSEDPNLQALDAWFELYDDPEVKMFGNYLDWDVLDQKQMELRTTFTPEQNRYLDAYLETDYSRHPEEIHEFIQMKDYVNDSGYWETADIAFTQYADRVATMAGRPIASYSELERVIRQTPDIRTKVRLEAIKKAIDARKTALRTRLRMQDPKLDIALVLSRGYAPRTAQARSIIR
tara:strand:+ start:39 stop:4916 length:4878 start_codon:yes stop_codon:yes gene_type:complete